MNQDLFAKYLEQRDNVYIKRALTDTSYKNYFSRFEKKEFVGETNKELATLGDAILKSILCILFLDRETPLSNYVQNFLTDQVLVEVIAKEYKLIDIIKFDREDDKIPKDYQYSENKETHKFIATAVEALIGAIYFSTNSLVELQEIIKKWINIINVENI